MNCQALLDTCTDALTRLLDWWRDVQEPFERGFSVRSESARADAHLSVAAAVAIAALRAATVEATLAQLCRPVFSPDLKLIPLPFPPRGACHLMESIACTIPVGR